MDLSQLSFSPIQILIGLLSAAIALAGSYWIYRRSKRDEEIRWRIENIYETGLEELNAVIDEDQFPGITRNRQEASFWDDISNWEKLRLTPQLIKQGTRYYRLLESFEKAERKFTPLNQDIVVYFPDDISWTLLDRGELVDAYWTVVAPAMEADGLDPDQEKQTHNWLRDHDFRPFLYALREYHDRNRFTPKQESKRQIPKSLVRIEAHGWPSATMESPGEHYRNANSGV